MSSPDNIRSSAAEEFRSELGRNQRSGRWLAQQIGISANAMSKKLRGQVSFTLEEVIASCCALGLDPGDIVTTIDKKPVVK